MMPRVPDLARFLLINKSNRETTVAVLHFGNVPDLKAADL